MLLLKYEPGWKTAVMGLNEDLQVLIPFARSLGDPKEDFYYGDLADYPIVKPVLRLAVSIFWLRLLLLLVVVEEFPLEMRDFRIDEEDTKPFL